MNPKRCTNSVQANRLCTRERKFVLTSDPITAESLPELGAHDRANRRGPGLDGGYHLHSAASGVRLCSRRRGRLLSTRNRSALRRTWGDHFPLAAPPIALSWLDIPPRLALVPTSVRGTPRAIHELLQRERHRHQQCGATQTRETTRCSASTIFSEREK